MAWEDSIGALWKKTSNKGKTFLTGSVVVDGHDIKIVGFINKDKKNERQPDIKLYRSKPFKKNSASEKQQEIVGDLF